MMMKRTRWFLVKTPPVRRGWYEYRGVVIPLRRLYWTGRVWQQVPRINNGLWHLFEHEDDQWRGLTERMPDCLMA